MLKGKAKALPKKKKKKESHYLVLQEPLSNLTCLKYSQEEGSLWGGPRANIEYASLKIFAGNT